jgi:poly(3-hydroxybutyrate) depolymerase
MSVRLLCCVLGSLALAACQAKGSGASDSAAGDGGGTDTGGDGGSDGGGDGGADTGARCSEGSGWAVGGQLVEVGAMSAFVYVPSTLPACAPLLVFAHGGGNAGHYADGLWVDLLGTGFIEGADFRGFALIVPGVTEDPEAGHTWELDMDEDLDALIDAARENLDLDTAQSFLVGQSAGGHMTAWMALTDPSRITGAGVVSAGLGAYFDYPAEEPDPKIPVYVAHDPDDVVVDYAYSVTLASELAAHGHAYAFADYDLGETGHGWSRDMGFTILDWLGDATSGR